MEHFAITESHMAESASKESVNKWIARDAEAEENKLTNAEFVAVMDPSARSSEGQKLSRERASKLPLNEL